MLAWLDGRPAEQGSLCLSGYLRKHVIVDKVAVDALKNEKHSKNKQAR